MSERLGDWDPEDAYDVDDPLKDRLDLLERVVDNIRDHPDDRRARRIADLRRVLDNVDGEDLNVRENRKLRKIREELEAI